MALALEIQGDGSLSASLANEEATVELGRRLAAVLRPGLVVYLNGELGAGKTTLVRGTLRALGHTGPVKSPTFALVELYSFSRLYLHHFDFYRFKNASEWVEAGFREAFDGINVCLIEWPEKAGEALPPADLHVRLQHTDTGRSATLIAGTAVGSQCLQELTAC